MANVTDPLISAVSGTDPQNLMEYITRQRIYDSRFWKEECFGLTVADVLEKAATLQCIGNLPTRFLSLVLKLLQLHPETELVQEAFVDQDEFKYVRALGCMYIRMTARPVDIYETLEARYNDFRRLRVWMAPEWSILHMDEFVHQMLSQAHVLGIALPRLPSRKTLEDAGYLSPGRPTALKDLLEEYGGPLLYLKHKATVHRNPAATEAWEKRRHPGGMAREVKRTDKEDNNHPFGGDDGDGGDSRKEKKRKKTYGTLFKNASSTKANSDTKEGPVSFHCQSGSANDNSEEYWNEERAKLGLKPLLK
jgi:pre-mRNA-splicing factor 38A